MIPEERIKNWKLHPSMRGQFGFELYKAMAKNKDIYLLCGDLGFGVFDNHKEDFPERCFSVGASEQSMADIAVGLAYSGKIPFVYSITTFLLYRPYETLKTYINHEKLNVKLIGSGRDKDYEHDGISHDASDAKQVLDTLPNIKQLWPETKEEIADMVKLMVESEKPMFISLKR